MTCQAQENWQAPGMTRSGRPGPKATRDLSAAAENHLSKLPRANYQEQTPKSKLPRANYQEQTTKSKLPRANYQEQTTKSKLPQEVHALVAKKKLTRKQEH